MAEDGVGLNALIQQRFGSELTVGGGRRMNDQALYICHIGKEGENLQAVDKLVRLLNSTFDFKREDGCAAIGKKSLRIRRPAFCLPG